MSDVAAYYDDLAEIYPEIARFPLRQHVVWPATRSLLGDVAGERVLDAGCGTGEHSNDLAEAGADVVGVDASEGMLETAREQFGDRSFDGDGGESAGSLSFHRANLVEGLPFEADSFDVVCCQMVCSHVRELGPLFESFARVLDDGGRLVVTTHHPFHDFRVVERREVDRFEVGDTIELEPDVLPERHPPVYPDRETYRVSYSEDGHTGEYHRRSLQALIAPLVDAGFAVEGLVEPEPDAEFREQWPGACQEYVTRPPDVLCLCGRLE